MFWNSYELLGNVFIVTSALLVYAVLVKYHKKRVVDFSLALILAVAISESIKYWVNKPRPVGGIELFEGSSFPSTHTTVAFTILFFYVLACHSLSFEKARGVAHHKSLILKFEQAILTVLLTILAVFTGLSRVWAEAHFQIDVVAGIILGLIICLPFMFYDVSLRKVK